MELKMSRIRLREIDYVVVSIVCEMETLHRLVCEYEQVGVGEQNIERGTLDYFDNY